MSSYMYFYIKSDNSFVRIGRFSRNSEVYRIVDDNCLAPYEEVSPLSYNQVQSLVDEVLEEIKSYEKEREKELRILEHIKSSNNPIEEKAAVIYDITTQIDSWNESIEEDREVYGWYRSLLTILQAIEFLDKNKNDYIYVGIECPNPEI